MLDRGGRSKWPECGVCHIMILPAVVIFIPVLWVMGQKQLHVTYPEYNVWNGHKTLFLRAQLCELYSDSVYFFIYWLPSPYPLEVAKIIIIVFYA